MRGKLTIEIKKRAWYEWLLWALWLIVEMFIMQNAIASGKELEPNAASVFWKIFAILLIIPFLFWLFRRKR